MNYLGYGEQGDDGWGGGGGAGGPSYGIWVGVDIGPVIEENTIVAGRGGDNGHTDNPAGDSGDARLQ